MGGMHVCVQMCVSPRGTGGDGAGGACSSKPRSLGFLPGQWGASQGIPRRRKGQAIWKCLRGASVGDRQAASLELGAGGPAAVRGWRRPLGSWGWPCHPEKWPWEPPSLYKNVRICRREDRPWGTHSPFCCSATWYEEQGSLTGQRPSVTRGGPQRTLGWCPAELSCPELVLGVDPGLHFNFVLCCIGWNPSCWPVPLPEPP